MADTVRIGVVGLGNMGSFHANYMNSVPGATLGGVCDMASERLETFGKKFNIATFDSYRGLIDSDAVDAVLIATPHPQHPEVALYAFEHGKHVLCEKPAAVTIKQARAMSAAHAKRPELVYAMMFQMRTSPLYQKLRGLIADGELGDITRMTWIVTDWFRTWSYYASGGWRATWAGEGGGVLINQCPHNLDLIPWLLGMMPSRVTGVAFLGKTHPIEVEDEVSAILEFPNGAIGHFITSTGESPGTNRLEIAGDRGKIVAEGGKLRFWRTRTSVRKQRETSTSGFEHAEAWEMEIPVKSDPGEGPKLITENFVAAIREGKPLVAPGEEGEKQLELGNAMLMAGVTRQPVSLPIDADAYEQLIAELARKYGGKKTLKTETSKVAADMSASFKAS